ncbi:ATP-binding protein [Tepidibacillus infernus]|uniref:ATP-binding protein n=1 Tax=Tepidibacillus infernus TaxID=1806172 RepID=UPI003B73465F
MGNFRWFIVMFSIMTGMINALLLGFQLQLLWLLILLGLLNLFTFNLKIFRHHLSNNYILAFLVLDIGMIHFLDVSQFVHVLYYSVVIYLATQINSRKVLLLTTLFYSLIHAFIEILFTNLTLKDLMITLYDVTVIFFISYFAYYFVRIYRQSESQSHQDYLTGLYNFKGFQHQLHHVWQNKPTAYHIIFIDFNDFKRINLLHGEEEGDQFLKLLANELRNLLPKQTLLSRYEGDCFVIGFDGDLKDIYQQIEMILQEISFSHTEAMPLKYSIATASYPEEATEPEKLVWVAQKKLALDKQQYKNQQEDMKKRMEGLSVIGQLAAGLAHEIRNPLTAVRGFIQLSAKESESLKQWENIIVAELDRVNQLVNDFLHLAQNRPVAKKEWLVQQVLEDVIILLQTKALLLGHEIQVETLDCKYPIYVDKQQFQQVFINIIQNALDALPKEGGTVKIYCRDDLDHIHICIEDNGQGIPKDKLKQIFEPFYTTKEEGTGLGLPICYRIVKENQGEIQVTSEIGVGTTFTISLPKQRVEEY